MTEVNVVSRKEPDERGAMLILAALLLPVLVLVAGLGVGGALVRSADSEAQRTADLAALAGATSLPNLGRPDATGLPTVPSSLAVPQPPGALPAPHDKYTPGSIYWTEDQASDPYEFWVSHLKGVGPIHQPNFGTLGSTWQGGCLVGNAQYAPGRARIGRAFANHDASGNPLVPVCANSGTGFAANQPDRIYMLAEMDSTGSYRLQRCLINPNDCASQIGSSETSTLGTMGTNYVTNLSNILHLSPNTRCLVNPTADGCFFNKNASKGFFGDQAADTLQTITDATVAGVTGIDNATLEAEQDDLAALSQLMLGATSSDTACDVPLDPASGMNLCNAGVNLASTLPSIMTPRVRSIVTHNVALPLVPGFVSPSDGGPGNFSFGDMTLARRAFKNAVVVPTISAGFSSQATCMQGLSLANAALALSNSDPLLRILPNRLHAWVLAWTTLLGSGLTPDTCGDLQADHNIQKQFTVDLNPALSNGQRDLITVASHLNDQVLNPSVNAVIAPAEGHTAAQGATQCSSDPDLDGDGSGENDAGFDASPDGTPPKPWCANVGDQAIRDLQSIYNPPDPSNAPSGNQMVQQAFTNHEPIAVVTLGKWITIPLPGGGPVAALTYWVPALDVVPATVTAIDNTNPNDPKATFQVLNTASNGANPPGLYKAVKIDPTATTPLCTTVADPSSGNCFSQPSA